MVKIEVEFIDQDTKSFECSEIKTKDDMLFLMNKVNMVAVIIPLDNVKYVEINREQS